MAISEEQLRDIVRKAFLAELPAIVDSVVKQMLQEQDLEASTKTAKQLLSGPYSRRPVFDATVLAVAKETPLEYLCLPGRAYNALVKRLDTDIRTVADLYQLKDTELMNFRYFGKTSLRDVHKALYQFADWVNSAEAHRYVPQDMEDSKEEWTIDTTDYRIS